MELSYLGITDKKEKQFLAKGITSAEELLLFLPTRYNDFTQETGLVDGDFSCVVLNCEKVSFINGRKSFVLAVCRAPYGEEVHVVWFNQSFMYQRLRINEGKTVYLCGKISYNGAYGYFSCSNPPVFAPDLPVNRRVYPVYSKIRGMSEEYLIGKIAQAEHDIQLDDLVPKSVREKYGVIGLNEAIKKLHFPSSMADVEAGRKRLGFDEMLYFALRMEEDGALLSKGSQFNIRRMSVFNHIKANLPYELTPGQKDAVNGMALKARDGRRISALVQGDVGCGKSIVAFLMAAAFAESGFQAAIMAPTQVLARQHYEELAKLLEGTGLTCALYEGTKMKAAERKRMQASIASGDTGIIVGTHALLGKDVEYANLALVIIDEEHKFGVLQKQALVEKASSGVHTITMSATPIPRSLSQVIYGSSVSIYTIKDMPPGRQPVKSCVTSKRDAVYRFMHRELEKGRQAYVVCPAIDKNEKRENIKSVSEIYETYKKEFPNYEIRALTGKCKKEELSEILREFNENKAQILISTTVIEVGVNVPNATLIVIENSENFGLAQLHQLRGRVGRGRSQGWCVFMSDEADNERLDIISHTTDGFVIAEKDMEMRGMGEFIGTKQSGEDKYVSIILSSQENWDMYSRLKEDARALIDFGELEPFLSFRRNLE